MSAERNNELVSRLMSGEPLTPAGEAVARELAGRLGFVKADSGDMMIAWYPPAQLANALAVEGGEAPEDIHLTIIFIPARAAVDLEVVKAVTLLCAQWESSLTGEISGTGRFVLDGEMDAFFCTVDIPNLESFRERLIQKLEAAGVWLDPQHGFTPHITIKYLPRGEDNPWRLAYSVPVEITCLTVQQRGDVRYTYDLWACDTEAEDSVAMQREHTMKAGMDACKSCGGPMLEKDGNRTCAKCEKSEAEKAAPALEFEYARMPDRDEVVKDAEGREWQYTLGPLYTPGVADAHDEYVTDDDLHRSVIQYSLKNDRRIKLQHDTSREVGTWVELVRWPYDHTITLTRPGEEPREVNLPAGTVYMGILWDDDAWAAIKDGRLGGLSLGGRAVRVASGEEPKDDEATAPAKAAEPTRTRDDDSVLDIIKMQAAERDDDRRLLRRVLDVLTKSVEKESPAPQVHVVQPAVNVAPSTADVHVASPTVNVEAPTIEVAAPNVEVTNEWRATKNVVTKRDEDGYVVETQTVPLDTGDAE